MFDKKLWNKKWSYWPSWPCPTCKSISLTLPPGKEREKHLIVMETGPSAKVHSHDAWDPEWIEKRFAAILKCHNPACGELVSVSGQASVEEFYFTDENGDDDRGWQDNFKPEHFSEAPPIFSITEKCPKSVSTQLNAAFALIWCDTAACANRLRAGAETLLDEQGIPKTTLSKHKKRERLSLHSRIEKLAAKDKDAATYLMAIKWLGNVGSHFNTEVSRDDLLDGTELFEAAIEKLYLKNAEKFAKMAAAINKRKGKPKKKKSPW